MNGHTPTDPAGASVSIRELAERLGLTFSTLHYWERRGLLAPVRRSGGRYYDRDQCRRVALIQMWQATGLMSLEEIAALLRGRTATADWRPVIHDRLAAMDTRSPDCTPRGATCGTC